VRIAISLAGLIVALAAVRERYDPRLVLFLDDVFRPKPAPVDAPLDGELALRLYEDTRPHVGKVAALQKGLVLVHEGRELVEEGYGFGAPIVQVGDVAYLSRHASVSVHRSGEVKTLVKVYTMSVADRPTRFLRVKYEDVDPLGTVVLSYTLRGPATIEVVADFADLAVAWDRAYLMNEQGAVNFQIFQDEDGHVWPGEELGRWRTTDAPLGCWLSQSEGVRFCVETEAGRRKYVGRERYNQYRWTGVFYLSWSGIDIEIDPPLSTYRYAVRVEAIDSY
jgi:hypothetical protein